jgi:hypothetical protein
MPAEPSTESDTAQHKQQQQELLLLLQQQAAAVEPEKLQDVCPWEVHVGHPLALGE